MRILIPGGKVQSAAAPLATSQRTRNRTTSRPTKFYWRDSPSAGVLHAPRLLRERERSGHV